MPVWMKAGVGWRGIVSVMGRRMMCWEVGFRLVVVTSGYWLDEIEELCVVERLSEHFLFTRRGLRFVVDFSKLPTCVYPRR